MRTFGVEEEFLIVDPSTWQLLPIGRAAVDAWRARGGCGDSVGGTQLAVELQQEQIEAVGPPQDDFAGQLEAIKAGRRVADDAVSHFGGRVVALGAAPIPVTPHPDTAPRSQEIVRRFGVLGRQQLTCGFHTHVLIESADEGVVVLDRIREWLHVVLALSANSPFWAGEATGFSSYRRELFGRWPNTGPTEIYGSAAAYDAHRAALLDSGVPLDSGMLYFDARLSDRHPTVEIRVADVCLDSRHAAAIATLLRALVETAVRDHDSGGPLPRTSPSVLHAWGWAAARDGISASLVNPASGLAQPAAEVVAQLLGRVRPVLVETEDITAVESAVADILLHGSGATRQRGAYRIRHDLSAVLKAALAATHAEDRRDVLTVPLAGSC